jgi:hypothetical protein
MAAADEVIKSQDKELLTSKELISAQGEQIDLLAVRALKAEDSLNAWYHDPIRMALLGFVIGSFACQAFQH